MAFDVATIKTAYDAYLTQKAVVAADNAAITALGARPVMPVQVLANADYNNVIATQATWDTNMNAAKTTLNTDTTTLRTLEKAVITAMGYGSAQPQGDNGQDQWVKLVGVGAGILTYTNWVAYGTGQNYLTVLTYRPLNQYPDTTAF